MSVLTRTELEKLSVMYEGDKNRDATSKIRGFLFQDYVAIMCLLKNQVKYMECIGIDEGEWDIKEKCNDCIFAEKCVKEGI